MTVARWTAGTLYQPGDVVQPARTPAANPSSLTNASFDDGDSGWTKGTGWTIETGNPFDGTYSAKYDGATTAEAALVSDDRLAVSPGDTVAASCVVDHGTSASGTAGIAIRVYWYDVGGTLLSYDEGTVVERGTDGAWFLSEVEAEAPPDAASFSLGARGFHAGSGDPVWADKFTLSYLPGASSTGLMFRATQAAPATSGSHEPDWPTVLDGTVVDNGVTWTAVRATRVVWEAHPILKTGSSEPMWPQIPGALMPDNSIVWECIPRRVEDTNCPSSKVVVIAASKVFAGDDDIIRYCATLNAYDWTSEEDAGYLPYGMRAHGSNPVAAMGLYRGNLVALNLEGFQMWQVDPDPAQMALLDALPIGCVHHRALTPVGDELAFLSPQGIRTLGMAAGSVNLQAGAIGHPVDSLVLASVAAAEADGATILSTYLPGEGQLWVVCSTDDDATVWVLTMNRAAKAGTWSRYVYPFPIDAVAHKDDALYLRSGDRVLVVDPDVHTDDVDGAAEAFAGLLQYAWLDLGSPGVTKRLKAFDYVGTGQAPSVSIGYDQTNAATFTTPYALSGDTLPGTPIPMPIAAPSFSVKLDYAGGAAWTSEALNLYLDDSRGQP